ncbi:hypothetical protein FKM82_026007 [Ascaphus truei]
MEAAEKKGPAKAQAELRSEPSYLAPDVDLEEEVTQDGASSREIDDVTSGGHSGAGWKQPSPVLPLYSTSLSEEDMGRYRQAIGSLGNQNMGEPDLPSFATGRGIAKLRIILPHRKNTSPYALPTAPAQTPAPVTSSSGSQSSQGWSGEESRDTLEERTGSAMDWGECFTLMKGRGGK